MLQSSFCLSLPNSICNSVNNFVPGVSMSFSLTKLRKISWDWYKIHKDWRWEIDTWINGYIVLLFLLLCFGVNFCSSKWKKLPLWEKALFSTKVGGYFSFLHFWNENRIPVKCIQILSIYREFNEFW